MGVRGHGTMYCNTNSGKSQRHLVDIRGHGTMYCNTNDGNTQPIWWVFVGTGTINRPLRLRGGRGKTWVNGAINNKMGNTKYINEPPRNIHLLRKCMAANTPQGVGADSSRPFFNPNQMVLMCRNDANCNAILWVFVGTGTINRTLQLRTDCQ